jgi:uncharacterized membrane protein YhaH (DUF805 family)
LAGRGNRKEYWLFVIVAVGLGVAADFLLNRSGGVGVGGVVFVAQIRRLHDLGRSGWWAVGLQAGTLGLGVALVALGHSEQQAPILVGAATLLIVVVLGLPRGTPHANRFGPPPGKAAADLAQTFS